MDRTLLMKKKEKKRGGRCARGRRLRHWHHSTTGYCWDDSTIKDPIPKWNLRSPYREAARISHSINTWENWFHKLAYLSLDLYIVVTYCPTNIWFISIFVRHILLPSLTSFIMNWTLLVAVIGCCSNCFAASLLPHEQVSSTTTTTTT